MRENQGFLLSFLITSIFFLCSSLVTAAGGRESIDKSNLMFYRGSDGFVREVKTKSDWKKRRTAILAGMQEAMGRLPDMEEFPALEPVTEETVREDSYSRLKVTIQVEEGDRLSCYLLLPHGIEGKVPGILALHPTHPMGKGDTAGLSGRENRNYGQELARIGFVVLIPDYPSFGDESDYEFSSDRYVSGTMKGVVNHIRCVDYLQSLPMVDSGSLGVIGHSLGGHNALFAAAFDRRLKVIVSSCGWTPFHEYYEGDLEGWTSSRYMPLIRTKYRLDPNLVPFDFYGVVASLAPRPFLSVSPLHDSNFEVEGVKKVVSEAGKVYGILGKAENLQVEYPESGHDFPPDMRERAYRFLAEHLGL